MKREFEKDKCVINSKCLATVWRCRACSQDRTLSEANNYIDCRAPIPIHSNTTQYPLIADIDTAKGIKFDNGKLRYDLIPIEVEEEMAKVLTFGAAKYAPNNWQKVEDFEERYYASLRRHLSEWRKGNNYDEESKLFHLSQALTCLAFLVWNARIMELPSDKEQHK